MVSHINLWLNMSQFVMSVAICDGKCRNLWQRQNMKKRVFVRICLYEIICILNNVEQKQDDQLESAIKYLEIFCRFVVA